MPANIRTALNKAFKESANPTEFAAGYMDEHVKAMKTLDLERVGQLITQICELRNRGGTIYVCGNGGKTALAMEFVNDLTVALPKSKIKAHTLLDPIAALTCSGNDYGYDEVFSRRLNPLGNAGDMLIALSGSGTSKNIINAISEAQSLGMYVVAVGRGDTAADMADLPITILTEEDGPTEDATLCMIHTVYSWFWRRDQIK